MQSRVSPALQNAAAMLMTLTQQGDVVMHAVSSGMAHSVLKCNKSNHDSDWT